MCQPSKQEPASASKSTRPFEPSLEFVPRKRNSSRLTIEPLKPNGPTVIGKPSSVNSQVLNKVSNQAEETSAVQLDEEQMRYRRRKMRRLSRLLSLAPSLDILDGDIPTGTSPTKAILRSSLQDSYSPAKTTPKKPL